MISDKIAHLLEHKYINLETYKKSGKAVRTPVWFVILEDQVFVITTKNTGKVKRIRNNQAVRIMPCGIRGEPKGDWVEGKARFADEQESETAVNLRHKKYGFKAKLVGIFRRDKPIVIAIQV